jgi:hypothetical protein
MYGINIAHRTHFASKGSTQRVVQWAVWLFDWAEHWRTHSSRFWIDTDIGIWKFSCRLTNFYKGGVSYQEVHDVRLFIRTNSLCVAYILNVTYTFPLFRMILLVEITQLVTESTKLCISFLGVSWKFLYACCVSRFCIFSTAWWWPLHKAETCSCLLQICVVFDVCAYWVLAFQFTSTHTQIWMKNYEDESCIMSYGGQQLQLICSNYYAQVRGSHVLACVW